MRAPGNVWAVVLAAGDGTRLESLTTNDRGDVVPKQFCSLRGGPRLDHDGNARIGLGDSSH
jgi:mannose-1-phosphate guanylyltransferase